MYFTSQSICLVIILSLVSLTIATADMTLSAQHEKWMAQHRRVYKDAQEKALRFEIFKDNVEYVESVNRGGNRTYQLGLNKFADLTNEEFKALFLGYKPNPSVQKQEEVEKNNFTYANLTDVPDSMDWRTYGAVTGVKNQYNCGCCWAFSAVAAIEGAVQQKTGQLMSLSEQEILDCIGNGMSCNGGNMEAAFSFVISNGLTTEDNYPYTKIQGSCDQTKMSASAATISNYQRVAQSEAALLNAVANQPVSVALEGSGRDFQLYQSGVFAGTCGMKLDHAVTAIGYGESNGTKYWLVKNSWGTGWGEDGFMRMQRDTGIQGGLCGLALDASYPIA